jgi:hypothetical protein
MPSKTRKSANPSGEARIVAQFVEPLDFVADARFDEHAPVILDVSGTKLTADDRRRLAHPLTGGAILFGRNWVNRQQVTELVAEMKAIRPDLLVCVDHEGGRVQRFRTDGFTHLPAMDTYGKRWMDDGAGAAGDGAMAATDAATAAGFVMAAELRCLRPRPELRAGAGPALRPQRRHRRPLVPSRRAHRHAAGQEPDAGHAPGRHGQLRQALSPATATSRPTAMSTCRSIRARSPRSCATTRGRTSGCPPRSPA